MKDYNEELLRKLYRPLEKEEVLDRIQFCLECLFKTKQVDIHDRVVKDAPALNHGMDFEELIGALLSAEDILKEIIRLEEKEEEVFRSDTPDGRPMITRKARRTARGFTNKGKLDG